jgi:hypothetical protein
LSESNSVFVCIHDHLQQLVYRLVFLAALLPPLCVAVVAGVVVDLGLGVLGDMSNFILLPVRCDCVCFKRTRKGHEIMKMT